MIVQTTGGCYTDGVWCRDASYILRAMICAGMQGPAKEWLQKIWASSNSKSSKNIVLDRGSPSNGLTQRPITENELLSSTGALPTTINQTYSEIYAGQPDIDSTALTVYATTTVYDKTGDKEFLLKVIHAVDSAMKYLESRDLDGDLLLE
jgi:glycogen debranching enzyme